MAEAGVSYLLHSLACDLFLIVSLYSGRFFQMLAFSGQRYYFVSRDRKPSELELNVKFSISTIKIIY